MVWGRPEYRIHCWRYNAYGHGSRLTMPVGILTGRIELMVMVRMLDRPHSISECAKVAYQIDHQGRLTTVFTTNDMYAVHGD